LDERATAECNQDLVAIDSRNTGVHVDARGENVASQSECGTTDILWLIISELAHQVSIGDDGGTKDSNQGQQAYSRFKALSPRENWKYTGR
jgi:hypothetical protein